MKYKFEQFNVIIVNPTVDIIKASYHLKNAECSVDIKLIGSDGSEFAHTLTDKTKPFDWTEESIANWTNEQLKKYEVL